MRLFVAVNLPPDDRAALHGAAEPLRQAGFPFRWTAADALHLTLVFLGEVAEPGVPEITNALDAVAADTEPFRLRIGGIGAFPNLSRPRVLWMAVQGTAEAGTAPLIELQRRIAAALEPLGFAIEEREYTPHLTLARSRKDARSGDFPDLPSVAAEVRTTVEFTVVSLDLMRSHLSPRGAHYERMHAAHFPRIAA